MPVRTRRMKSSRKGVRLPEGSSSSDEDTEMSPPAKSMVDELKSYLDTRIQERMEAFNENVQTEPPMVQKDDTTQLLLQILNDQNGRMKKLEQAVRYTVNPVVGSEERPTNTNLNTPIAETHRVEQPQVEQIITEPTRVEPPHFEPPRVESPRFEPPRVKQPRDGATKSGSTSSRAAEMEPPRFEPPRIEPPIMDPPRFEQPRMEPPRMGPPRMEQPWFEQPRMEPPRFEQPRMEPPRFEQPRMEPPCFEQPRMDQPWKNRLRNDYNGQNFPKEEVFDRGVNLEERNRNIGVEPNPRPVQGQDLRDQIFEVIDQALGLGHRRTPRHPYRKPYPKRIDREEWPRGFKIPDFTMFSGKDEKTALEHISRFTAKLLLGMPRYRQILLVPGKKWRKNSSPILPRSNIGVSMADLARLKQKPDESAEQFIMRFKRIRTRCLTTLPEAEYIKIAIDGLNFELRKKFEGITFFNLFELSERASRFEGLLKEENQMKNSSYGTYYQDPNYEIDLAEYIEKADEIFDILYKANQLKIIGRHRFPSKEELKGRDYCKWHSTYTHATKSCVTFRNVVQDKIDRNVLKFLEIPQESMAVDADLFPFVDVNTTSVDLSSLMPHKNLHIRNNKSKVNLLQAFGPQERQLVREMSNLKIERSAATGQSNSAKVNGRSLSIQDNNVHANKGKNVACLIGQPIISYKEMLRKEPLKVSLKSDEDETICERCSHILAKCLSRTKKEDNYKPQESEEPRSVSRSIRNSGSESRSAPQVHSIQSRLGSQHEQQKMARSRHDLQYEQQKMARSRLEQSQETPIRSVQSSPIEDAEDIKSIEDSEGIEDIEDVENIGDIEDMEDIENIEDIDTFENSEGIDDIEVEETDDIEEMEGSETIGCTKNGIQTGEPEIESQKPKNGKTLSCNAITLPREFMATTWVQRKEDAREAVPILLAEDEECRDIGKIIFEKPTLAMCQHLKPLYIKAHMDGRPVNRVLVDNGAAVNILPTSMDGTHSGYNQIFITEGDVHKTAFRCPGSIGTFE
uniref:Retrotransposon gag domain-containing protein n=1 Tax=Fagus sylvatica TaxID=28930 RepID=A0A2N9FWA1_FAGSY